MVLGNFQFIPHILHCVLNQNYIATDVTIPLVI